ncbi:MAG: hypothetical protein V3R91_10420, partial [Myxococcota bacterium]
RDVFYSTLFGQRRWFVNPKIEQVVSKNEVKQLTGSLIEVTIRNPMIKKENLNIVFEETERGNGSSERRLIGEDEKTWEEQRSCNEVLETVSYEMSPVVSVTLKTYMDGPIRTLVQR